MHPRAPPRQLGGTPCPPQLASARPNDDEDGPLATARRREGEKKAKQVKLAAAIGERATKDASDTVVLGVMPGAKAVGRMAARRIADDIADGIADKMPAAGGLPGLRGRGRAAGGAAGDGGDGKNDFTADAAAAGKFVSELAKEIAAEYEKDMKRAAELVIGALHPL